MVQFSNTDCRKFEKKNYLRAPAEQADFLFGGRRRGARRLRARVERGTRPVGRWDGRSKYCKCVHSCSLYPGTSMVNLLLQIETEFHIGCCDCEPSPFSMHNRASTAAFASSAALHATPFPISPILYGSGPSLLVYCRGKSS
jgi:hypothetical protein